MISCLSLRSLAFDGFALLDDDEELDMDEILGGDSDEPAPFPPASALAEKVKPQPKPEQTPPAKTREEPIEAAEQPLKLFRRLQTRKR